MNTLLIYPRYPDTFWSFKHVLKFISKKAAYPPLGLLTVASMLPEKWNKKLVDVNVAPLEDKDIQWADMVLIGAMLVQADNARKIIKRCKSMGKRVVVGGPAFTASLEKFDGVDHFVLNEAEVTLPAFLKDLEEGNPKNVYTSTERPDITNTPVPMWSLIDFNDYATMAIQYSRGCPFNCEFCDIIIMNGRIPRTKTPAQLINEVESLYDAGWRGPLFIVDDNFIGNKKKVKKLLPELIEWQSNRDYPFILFTEASIDIAQDEELLEMMCEANFDKVFLGIETPEEDSLKECGKYQNTTCDMDEAIQKIHQTGMQVMGGFIVGFDSDPRNIFKRQIEFIQKTGVVVAMVGILSALPGTKLWDRLRKEGRLLGDSSGQNTDGSLNFIPRMGREVLVNGYKKIVSTIYSPENYYHRIHTLLKNYKPRVNFKPSLTAIKAFLKSIWEIGVKSKSRFLYWKLILKTLFTNYKALPDAVQLAIFGLHFEKTTRTGNNS